MTDKVNTPFNDPNEFITLDALLENWKPLYCDSCEQEKQNIVRQNAWDGKLICKQCWEDTVKNCTSAQLARDMAQANAEGK